MSSRLHRAAAACLVLVLVLATSPASVARAGTSATHGTAHIPISCAPAAQADFDAALTLWHHMTYPQAREAFAALSMREPECAMAHWGVAMTLFQPLWPSRPSAEDLEIGRLAVQQARAAGDATPPHEAAFLEAAGAFFDEPGDYWQRIARWAAAAEAQHVAFPDDDEATLQYALALLATAPAGDGARAHADRAAVLLEGVLARRPDHPGALHYLVHASDAPERVERATGIARRYEAIAPDNPHALHMPTHLYTRLGDWPGSIRGNRRAAEAALRHPAGPGGEYVWDEFAHAIEYLVYAHLQRGEDRAAEAERARLVAVPNLEPSFKSAFHLASTQARIALEQRDWRAAAAIRPRTPDTVDWDRFAWAEAIQVFAHARGVQESATGTGAGDAAVQAGMAASLRRLDDLAAKMAASGETAFERDIRVLRGELDAWVKYHAGDAAGAEAAMRAAAALEAATPKHPVTPGPTLPAEEQLGDLLLALDRPADAQAAYERALAAYPNRFRALAGAARAAAAAGDAGAARHHRDTLRTIAGAGDRAAELAGLRD